MDIEPRQKQFDFDGAEVIKAEVLETFLYEDPGKPLDIAIDTDEFTAVCPWTGLPDFSTVIVSYVPDKVCLELRAYKFYLMSYRTVGMVQEHITRRILNDLVEAVQPLKMSVKTDYKIRGGIHTVCTAEYKKE
ncbi:MAG TPA: NADPH-dependent 7-cyano-7-deazaguanine reductase QueF [candidate division Zixibacteria bacterium]|jgi:7-cyano-7-deazaguanine reductase|nr:NADPH-dependent 7-cyano-7-deazaguanine reductase QueF [candidate division Zixibacteria bacterium]